MRKTLILSSLFFVNFSFGQIQNGLIAAFKFQGNLNDQSTSGITPTNSGLTYTLDNLGNSNSAIQVDGSSYAYFNSSAVKVSFPLSISVWVKLNNVSQSSPIFTSDNVSGNYYGYFLNTVAGTGQVGFNFSAGLGGANSTNRRTYVSDLTLTQGQWHQVVVVANSSSNIQIYIDCQLSTGSFNGTGSTTMAYSTNESRIGSHVNSNPSIMNGELDELLIWNRALTATEISNQCTSYLADHENEALDCLVFPNPVKDLLNIQMTAINEINEVKVYDHLGRSLAIGEIDKINQTIDLSPCPDGVLQIEIHTAKGVIRKKIVKGLN